MSQAHPRKGKITRAPQDSEFDQVILIFAAALGIALVSIWIVWSNGEAAATSFMLHQKSEQAQGWTVTGKADDVEYVIGYGYEGPNGKVWERLKLNNAYWARKASEFARTRSIEKEKKITAALAKEIISGFKTREVEVLYHPGYPRFFATKAELQRFAFNFRLTVGSLAALLLAIFLGFRSIRKYKRLKAIAAYY